MKRSRKVVLSSAERVRIQNTSATCTDAALRTRYLIVLHSAEGWRRTRIAQALRCSLTLVSRVRRRWQEEGEAGLIDRREDNGDRKVTDEYVRAVKTVLGDRPKRHGHRRPTWTKRMLIDVCDQRTGVVVSLTTMGRVLKQLKARRGRPKPMAPCPWSEKDRKTRMKLIHRVIRGLPADEVAYWEDEADIDLNPRLGDDWMLPGTQRVVMTPGKNVKRYIAGAMNAHTDQATWVSGRRKDSGLFIMLLRRLLQTNPTARRIHLIVDNFSIHSSRRTQTWMRDCPKRIQLHFLPPYCPDDNRIERCLWREMHANVTYNHQEKSIESLMHEVSIYLRRHNRSRLKKNVAESRMAI